MNEYFNLTHPYTPPRRGFIGIHFFEFTDITKRCFVIKGIIPVSTK